jgi:hypothetical protein
VTALGVLGPLMLRGPDGPVRSGWGPLNCVGYWRPDCGSSLRRRATGWTRGVTTADVTAFEDHVAAAATTGSAGPHRPAVR